MKNTGEWIDRTADDPQMLIHEDDVKLPDTAEIVAPVPAEVLEETP